jgi:hypothetical protein
LIPLKQLEAQVVIFSPWKTYKDGSKAQDEGVHIVSSPVTFAAFICFPSPTGISFISAFRHNAKANYTSELWCGQSID